MTESTMPPSVKEASQPEKTTSSTTSNTSTTKTTEPEPEPEPEPAPAEQTVQQSAAPDPTAPIAVDPDVEDAPVLDDGDSALGSTLTNASTSLASSIRNYVYENGRRYHSYRQGEYFAPNDDEEQDRMDMGHHMFGLRLGGGLFRAPITTNPQHVLDLGTGTGIWAIQFADEYPSAQVIGTDLSPIQPSWVPSNCRFLVDDMESPWLFNNKELFDYIHTRTLGGSVRDWTGLFKQARQFLKPGGWIETQEWGMDCYSDEDPELSKVPNLRQWYKLMKEMGMEIGKSFDPPMKQHMEEAGLVDVHDDIYKTPFGRWSKDPALKELGIFILTLLLDSIEPYTLALLTRVRKWSVEECHVFLAKVRNDIKEQAEKTYLYAKLRFTYARRPLDDVI